MVQRTGRSFFCSSYHRSPDIVRIAGSLRAVQRNVRLESDFFCRAFGALCLRYVFGVTMVDLLAVHGGREAAKTRSRRGFRRVDLELSESCTLKAEHRKASRKIWNELTL